jgi:hypothetical protein
MKIAPYFFGLMLVIFAFQSALAQEFRSGSITLTIGTSSSIATFDQSVTALMIETADQNNFDNLLYFYRGNWHHLEHGHNSVYPFRSDPIVLAKEEISLLLKSITQQMVVLHTVFCPTIHANYQLFKKNNVPCAKPNTIPPSSWRVGLPDPKTGRLSTQVEHCIVHHAAGSNFNTDYYNVVRNIYLLHTQTNGWDDIGYNYLIAQDGALFIGRDPQGVNTEDNIQGAHFCAKNALTMGTCLLGNYSDTIPTDTTWAVLKQLLVWKLMKEQLNPLDSSLHPDANANMLPVVAGHRDGCNTDCPGQNVFVKLPQLRLDLKNAIDFCKLSRIGEIDSKIIVYQKEGYLNLKMEIPQNQINNYQIINSNGIEIAKDRLKENKIKIDQLPAGLYYLILHVGVNQYTNKFPLLR